MAMKKMQPAGIVVMSGRRVLAGLMTKADADGAELALPFAGEVPVAAMLRLTPVEAEAGEGFHVAELAPGTDESAVLAALRGARTEAEWVFHELRDLLSELDEEGYGFLSRAASLQHWNRQTQFCGCCGSPNGVKADELAKLCGACGAVVYPRISPAIIVAVRRDRQLLLAHAKHFAGGMFSLVAGFVEPGEQLEHAVAREVMEEVGVRVKNIRYLGSQPWPFADSLMTGFTAEWESGEPTPDGVEISEAGWFGPDEWPMIPSTVSIAGKIIRKIQQEIRTDCVEGS